VASSQPVTWPLRASELAKLGLEVPGRAELPERLPGAPWRAPRWSSPASWRAVRRVGQVATDDRAPWPGRDWHAVGCPP